MSNFFATSHRSWCGCKHRTKNIHRRFGHHHHFHHQCLTSLLHPTEDDVDVNTARRCLTSLLHPTEDDVDVNTARRLANDMLKSKGIDGDMPKTQNEHRRRSWSLWKMYGSHVLASNACFHQHKLRHYVLKWRQLCATWQKSVWRWKFMSCVKVVSISLRTCFHVHTTETKMSPILNKPECAEYHVKNEDWTSWTIAFVVDNLLFTFACFHLHTTETQMSPILNKLECAEYHVKNEDWTSWTIAFVVDILLFTFACVRTKTIFSCPNKLDSRTLRNGRACFH